MNTQSDAPHGWCEEHDLERQVCRELRAAPGIEFTSLVVRRVEPDVVCLEGILQCEESALDEVSALARQVAGVQQVLNHLVVQPTTRPRTRPR